MSSIAVVFGGLSQEHDISILTGLQAARLLASDGRHDVMSIYWTRAGEWLRVPVNLEGPDFAGAEVAGAARLTLRLPEGFTERRRMKDAPVDVDVVVNCCHGGPGEDGALAALLSMAGLSVTGPSPETSAWMMDKLASAALVPVTGLDRLGIEPITTVVATDATTQIDLPRPWVVKPRFGGSSVGVEVGVEDLDTVRALARTGIARGGTVVQPELTGWSDLQLSVRRFPELQASAIERPLTPGVYGYREKYLAGADGMESAQKELPADLPDDITKRITEAAKAIVEAVGLDGAPRIDFLYDGGKRLALCEVNTIPGSLALYLWAASGVNRTQVILDLIEEARARPALPPQWSATTDRAALRAAGTVASKLQ